MSAILQTLDKQPGESRMYEMKFHSLLATGETISSITSVAVTPAGLTTVGGSSISVDGRSVFQRFSGGTAGAVYKITIKVVTSAGNTLEGEGLLAIIEK